MSERRRLETTLLDLATEIFHLKSSLATLAHQNENMAKLLNSLRGTLAEKGIISEMDLSSAIELAEIEAVAASLPEFPNLRHTKDEEPSSH
jgi:hypothetical protein